MAIEELLNYAVSQALEGERIPIRILQGIFAFGIATIIYNTIPSIPYFVLISVLTLTALLHSYFRAKLENLFNNVMFQLRYEITDIKKVLNFINSVLFSEHNILDDILKAIAKEHKVESKRERYLILLRISFYIIAPSIFLLASIVLLFLMLNSISPNKFLEIGVGAGFVLIILSYIFVVILGMKPVRQAHPSTGDRQNYQYLMSTVIEKYTYENIIKARSIPKTLVSVIALLFPTIKLEIKKPLLWFGLFMCGGKLADLVNELKDKGLADVKGEITKFFQCGDLGGTEKWVELHEISTEEMLGKIMGKTDEKNRQTIKIVIKKDAKTVGHVVMKAWKGCKIHKRLRKRSKDEYKLVIDNVEPWKIISVIIVGIREYVENLGMRIELATRRASVENILCEEEQAEQ